MRLAFGLADRAEWSQVAFTRAGPLSILRPIQVRIGLGDGRGVNYEPSTGGNRRFHCRQPDDWIGDRLRTAGRTWPAVWTTVPAYGSSSSPAAQSVSGSAQ